MNAIAVMRDVREVRSRHGLRAAMQYLADGILNTFMFFEILHIIVLDRDNVQPPANTGTATLSTRLATLEDLLDLQADPKWELCSDKMRPFLEGDACILSYVDEQLAGYTWSHSRGRPQLRPGLILSIPKEYLYNYAALTLPEFRGLALQSFRHRAVLDAEQWRDRKGLMGYVSYVNHSSRRGQAKSGYRRVGSIWLFGSAQKFWVYCDGSLRRLGIARARTVALPERPLRANRT